jgi:hypothetical protein
LSAWLGNRSEGSGRAIPGGSGATIVSLGVSAQPTCERPDSVDELVEEHRRIDGLDADDRVCEMSSTLSSNGEAASSLSRYSDPAAVQVAQMKLFGRVGSAGWRFL